MQPLNDHEYEKVVFLAVAGVLLLLLVAIALVGKADSAEAKPKIGESDVKCMHCYDDDYGR